MKNTEMIKTHAAERKNSQILNLKLFAHLDYILSLALKTG